MSNKANCKNRIIFDWTLCSLAKLVTDLGYLNVVKCYGGNLEVVEDPESDYALKLSK